MGGGGRERGTWRGLGVNEGGGGMKGRRIIRIIFDDEDDEEDYLHKIDLIC